MLGAGFSMVSSVQQANAQADILNFQAGVEATNTALRRDDLRRQAKRTASSQFAQFGALGGESAFGSAPDAVAKTAFNSEFNIFNDSFRSSNEILALNTSARNTRRAGQQGAVGTLLDYGYRTSERLS